jgi:hypothetical protein
MPLVGGSSAGQRLAANVRTISTASNKACR